ncbi:unnamed protein product [Lepeophtheirus salmonis]|uniref:(salmon louse) hypothetical protein n=1 Tax=Lepeophtheirus salmonis TaxID=72036 RepID=A0A0K2U3A8_LEPSM|nr:unnamed protein product [Lepeophtheirus salmonis]CAF2912456.1 unnamed protein product [Lepeophtheirus salmonis]
MSPRGRNTKSILVTGCDSGVGLEVVKSLAQQAVNSSSIALIIAAAKNPENSELNNIARNNQKVKVVRLDLEDYKSFGHFADEVQRKLSDAGVQHLSALVNSAALHYNASLNTVDAGQMIKAFSVNAVSPLMLIKALSKQLENGAQQSNINTAGANNGGFIYSATLAGGANNASGLGNNALNNVNANNFGTTNNPTGYSSGNNDCNLSGPSDAGMGSAAHFQSNDAVLGGMQQSQSGVLNKMGNNQNNMAGNAAAAVRAINFGIGGPNSGAILANEGNLAYNGNGAGALVINLTSGLSSITANNIGSWYAYRASKAALNMITKSVASDMAQSGVLVYSLNIDNAALNANSGANNAMNTGNLAASNNSSDGYNAQRVAQSIVQLLDRANANLNGSLINVQGAPLLY